MAQPALPQLEIVAESESVWNQELKGAGCPACRQVFLIPETWAGLVCPHCAQNHLVPQPARMRLEPPELIIPARLDTTRIQSTLNEFLRPVWLKPDDLTVANLSARLIKVYWPMWLVDSDLTGDWQAEVGYDYQVKSSQEHFNNGEWRSRVVNETRIRWEPRVGNLVRRYNNILVPASSYHKQRLQQIGSYPFDTAASFEVSQASDAVFQVPDHPPESAWPMARSGLDQAAGEECQQASAGQHIRNFQIEAQYDQVNWSQLLLPLYTTYYADDDGRRHLVVINGHTGMTSGVRMASRKKGWLYGGILAGGSLFLILLALVLFLLAAVFPPGGAIALVLAFLAFALGAAALVPILWTWQWNQRQVGK